MDDKLWKIKYRAEQLEAAERLAKVINGKVISRIGVPIARRHVTLPGDDGLFITAQGYKDHAQIELSHVPIGLAEQVLKLVVKEEEEEA